MAYQSALQAIARQKAAANAPAIKTQDMNDPYDPELAASSKALYPGTFTPPAIGAPGFDDYFAFVFGKDTAINLVNAAFQKNAPSYSNVLLNINGDNWTNLDEYIVNQLDNSIPIGQIKQNLASGTVKTPTGEIITGLLAPADYNALVSTYANELDKAKSAVGTVYKDYLTSTVNSSPEAKNYLAGLPDTKLKYAITENLAEGFIDWKSHPEVDKYLKNPEYQALIPKAKSIASGKLGGYSYGSDPRLSPEMNKQAEIQNTAVLNKVVTETKDFKDEGALFKEFSTSRANPYKDEAIRRQGLKKKSYKP